MTETGIDQRWAIPRLAIVLILSVLASGFLSACNKHEETVYVYLEEPVYISVGESAVLELDNMPDGKTAADFTWTITGDTAEISNGIVTGILTDGQVLTDSVLRIAI